jgi:dTMP kinase
MKGLLVCIEGIDGSGKKTQSSLLFSRLKKAGQKVSLYAYPDYKSAYGKIIKNYLNRNVGLSVMELCLLMVADMSKDAKDVQKKINEGEVVIMDRYFLSTIAYQTAGGLEYETVKKLEEAVALPLPSLIVYLDLNPTQSMNRKMGQKGMLDRHEGDLKYLEGVKRVYDTLYKEKYTGARWIRLEGALSKEEIHNRIMNEVNTLRIL